jgi:hypothetical protein
LPAEGGGVIAGGTDEEVQVAVVIAIKEQYGPVFEVGELPEYFFFFFNEAIGGLQVELPSLAGGPTDVYILAAVAVYIAYGCAGSFA